MSTRTGIEPRGQRAAATQRSASLTVLPAEGTRGRTFMTMGVFTTAIFILFTGLAPAEGGAA